MSKKTLILHDTFLYKGGGERLILMMGKTLGADIASGFFHKNSFDLRKEGFKGKMIEISSEIFKKGFRHLKLKFAFAFKTHFLKDYDTVIFSGDCISAVRNCKKGAKKIYYCHTPPRYLYDRYEWYLNKIPAYLKPAFIITSKFFKFLYEKDIKKFDLILTNSENTKKRIKKFLGLEAEVLYPPVDLDEFKYIDTEDYYLSFARLSEIKRVDKIVKAFKKMPDKKLKVIYGANDPQKEDILNLAEGYSNIECLTLKDNSLLKEYIGKSIATIYIPVDEDFGMSPVESMACGKPVIGVNEGGLKESIINNQTGFLISPKAEIEEIIKAVNKLDKNTSIEMRKSSEKRAKDFSLEEFGAKLKAYTK